SQLSALLEPPARTVLGQLDVERLAVQAEPGRPICSDVYGGGLGVRPFQKSRTRHRGNFPARGAITTCAKRVARGTPFATVGAAVQLRGKSQSHAQGNSAQPTFRFGAGCVGNT